MGAGASQPWESSLWTCGGHGKAMRDWELSQSPILGFPFHSSCPQRLSGPALHSCNFTEILGQPRRGYESPIFAVASKILAQLPGEGKEHLAGRECWKRRKRISLRNTLKKIKMRGIFVPKNMSEKAPPKSGVLLAVRTRLNT